jgi:glutathione S-transferase
MKLYLSPGACSLSPHIALKEAGLKFETEAVNLGTHKTATGKDFYEINPKGKVPTLVLDSGDVLTEGPAIVQYIADQAPNAKLAPPNGTIERSHLQEWLNFVTTELHKSFGPLFNKNSPEETKKTARETIEKNFAYVEKKLAGKEYLLGAFSVADGYFYTILTWAKAMGFELNKWPNVNTYFDRVAARPAVKATLAAEHDMKPAAAH